MKSEHNLNPREESTTLGQTAEKTALEFASADELLRHDALHTPVPPNIARRLQESIGPLPAPRRPWWRKWFGRRA